MKLAHPIQNFSWSENISQLFGLSKDFYQSNFNIPAHNGLDITVPNSKGGYGEPILATHNGTVEKIEYDVPHRSRGNGISILDDTGLFSTIYWHLSSFNVNLGDKVVTGQKIALMGNSGQIFPKPTPANPYGGTHLHFGVKKHYLPYDMGYSGYVDPTPLIFNEGDELGILFSTDLRLGSTGDFVSWLQTIMKIEGFGEDYDPTGLFGPKTLRDVMKYQQRYGITPSLGYCGTKTKTLLNKTYSKYA